MSFMLAVNLLIKPIWILLENMVQDSLGHETFGMFSSLLSLVVALSVFSDFGINHYITNTVAKDHSKYSSTLSVFFSARIIITLVFPLLSVGIGWLVGYRDEYLWYLFLISITQAALQFVLLFRAKLQAFQNFKLDSIASVLDRIVLISIILSLLFYNMLNASLFINARLYSVIIAGLILFYVVLKKYGGFKFTFSLSSIKEVVIKTLPFTLMTLLYAFNERIDMFMLERLHSATETGLYAAAYRWYDAFMMLVWLVMPLFFAKFSANDSAQSSSIINHGKLLIAIPIIFIGGILFSNNHFLFFLFKHSNLEEVKVMSLVLSVLIISFVLNGIFVIYGTYLNASGFVKKVNKLVLVSALLNVLANFIFIPQHGAIAAAYTTLVSTFVLSIGYYFLIKKHLDIDKRLLSKLVVLTLLFFTLLYIFQSYFIPILIVFFTVAIVLFVVLLFSLQLYRSIREALSAK